MRKILIAVMAMLSMFWFTTPTHATLWDRGGGLIYDDDLNITWLQDAGMMGRGKFWPDAMTWAGNLVYGGYDDWRLPTTPGTTFGPTSEGEMGHLYYTELGNPLGGLLTNVGLFTNLQPYYYWSGTEYYSNPNVAWFFNFGCGVQLSGFSKNYDFPAWGVRDGDVVPEPTTMLLLGSGLVGLLGFARRKFKK